jgi:hypothetical protein
MTAVHEGPIVVGREETLLPLLRVAHGIWLREVDRFLLPVIMRDASFWERWTAVRYLADQFQGQYRRECALLEELRPFLGPEAAERLIHVGERIGQLQRELDRVGRRRGTAKTGAVLGRELLHLLRSWCGDIEQAAGQISRTWLAEESDRLVGDLELYTRVHAS